ncbi:hypothetical protein [Bartonella rattaustraliani]|uniref:hypothetical protein n=1 Tax=Bartonella rattaustraliani TaxID=481139 RepID=UPI00030E17FF|nr:hypothetical protein [Bartonella rattaustraliani]
MEIESEYSIIKSIMDIYYGDKFMNIKYYITAFATFASISAAQGSTLLGSQKLVKGITIPSKDFSFAKKVSNILSEAFQEESSSIDNVHEQIAVELVSVSSSSRRCKRAVKKGRQPNPFCRSPMSF